MTGTDGDSFPVLSLAAFSKRALGVLPYVREYIQTPFGELAMSANVITEQSARTHRTDRAGNNMTIDVKAGSRKAVITDAKGRKRKASYLMRKNTRHGYVVEKGYGYRVEQPRAISKLPRNQILGRAQPKPTR